MAFTGTFTAVQDATDLSLITVTDTSSYASEGQGTFSGRRITLYKVNGDTLVPTGTTTTYVNFPFSSASINIDVLDRDYALVIFVEWLSNAPVGGSTYTKTTLYCFTGNLEQFYYNLTQLQASNPLLVNDNNYFNNKLKLRVYIDSAGQAVPYNDQYSSQLMLDLAYNMQQNQQTLF